jgi:hypothetical protein
VCALPQVSQDSISPNPAAGSSALAHNDTVDWLATGLCFIFPAVSLLQTPVQQLHFRCTLQDAAAVAGVCHMCSSCIVQTCAGYIAVCCQLHRSYHSSPRPCEYAGASVIGHAHVIVVALQHTHA